MPAASSITTAIEPPPRMPSAICTNTPKCGLVSHGAAVWIAWKMKFGIHGTNRIAAPTYAATASRTRFVRISSSLT